MVHNIKIWIMIMIMIMVTIMIMMNINNLIIQIHEDKYIHPVKVIDHIRQHLGHSTKAIVE
jgi:hypothetical protein